MTKIGFIGVGNMGGPMALNLATAGHDVCAFDLVQASLDAVVGDGVRAAGSNADAVKGADVVITMLPAGGHVDAVYANDVLPNVSSEVLLMDCSTIDMATSKAVHEAAAEKGCLMVDAPVSGGVKKAVDGSLTMMVGGSDEAFAAAKPYLDVMGANIFNCGDAGAGQAVKMCNNMMLGIQMASTAEAFVLGEKLGIDPEKMFEVINVSSGQCWSLSSYCPVPGLVPSAPSNNNFEGGFGTTLMLKDMNLALEAAKAVNGSAKVAEMATSIYQDYLEEGSGGKDFSGIIELIRKG
tara:strand:+ start:593 stop:1474 length:882 start_codon:yes stop_codon:yes gene_type:complete